MVVPDLVLLRRPSSVDSRVSSTVPRIAIAASAAMTKIIATTQPQLRLPATAASLRARRGAGSIAAQRVSAANASVTLAAVDTSVAGSAGRSMICGDLASKSGRCGEAALGGAVCFVGVEAGRGEAAFALPASAITASVPRVVRSVDDLGLLIRRLLRLVGPCWVRHRLAVGPPFDGRCGPARHRVSESLGSRCRVGDVAARRGPHGTIGPMTRMGDLLGPDPVLLPGDSEAEAELLADENPAIVAAAHPSASVAWAALAEEALADDKAVTAYAYARTGYHRGLDQLRRNGWKGFGPVPYCARTQPRLPALCGRAGAGRRRDRRDRRVPALPGPARRLRSRRPRPSSGC